MSECGGEGENFCLSLWRAHSGRFPPAGNVGDDEGDEDYDCMHNERRVSMVILQRLGEYVRLTCCVTQDGRRMTRF